MALTPEQKSEVLRRFNLGESAAVIAKEFHTTRSAIIGVIHRLRQKDPGAVVRKGPPSKRKGVTREGASPAVPAPRIERPTLPKVTPFAPAPDMPVSDTPPVPVVPASPVVRGEPVSILDAKFLDCRYVVGNGGEYNLVMFCGVRVKPGTRYCKHHYGLVYQPMKSRTRRVFVFRKPKETKEITLG